MSAFACPLACLHSCISNMGLLWVTAYGAVRKVQCADMSATVLSLQGLGNTEHPRNVHAAVQREPKQISRDALAALLGVAGERGVRAEGVRVLDVRRHDECVLYGSIPGAAHKC